MKLKALSVAARLLFIFGVTQYPFNAIYAHQEIESDSTQRNAVGESFKDCDNCPEMIVIPKGSFMMGDIQGAGDPDEQFIHKVTFKHNFAVGKYEVTWNEWEACVADQACPAVPYTANSVWGKGRRPVIHVYHREAFAYVKWLNKKTGENYRLISEAEFEYVARAGTQTKFHWGNEIGKDHANCTDCLSRWKRGSDPVGTYASNQFGVFDMLGNLWEVVEDCYHPTYEGAPTDGSARTDGECKSRVIRGGGWHDDAWNMRSANRRQSDRSDTNALNGLGFRVALNLVNPSN